MKNLFKVFLIGALAMSPLAAIAAIDGSHHDMTVYLGAGVTKEKCAMCHSVSLADIADAGLGTVGTFCAVVCHEGGINSKAPNAFVTPPGYIAPLTLATTAVAGNFTILGASHGFDPAIADANIQYDALATSVPATNWPHANKTLMQCTTCHAVHDSTNTPFLNAPLSTGNNATAFCSRCHTGSAVGTRAGRFTAIGTPGAHPAEFVNQDDGTAALDGGNATAGGRALAFKAPLVHVATAATTRATFDAILSAASGDAWKLGGHFQDVTNGMPIATTNGARVGCYSCHSAHQNQTGLSNQLLLGDRNAARTSGASSVLCVGCHGPTPAVNTNPIWDAGLTGYGHPANETAAAPYVHDHAAHAAVNHPNLPTSGTFPIDVLAPLESISATDNLNYASLAFDRGANGEVLCVSCHDVHAGVTGQMAIRQINTVDTATELICNGCHGTSGTTSYTAGTANWHHPTLAAADIDPAYATGALAWDDGSGNMNMGDGLGCGDCHVFGDTAHNW